MTREHRADLIILGAGPAGYTAAIYAARASRRPILNTGMQPGGQLVTTTDVENYPGFANVIQGPWLVEQMQAQAEYMGTRIVYDHIVSIETDSRPFRLIGDNGDHYLCDALIYATGAQARWLGIPTEETFRGFGVSACATCDGFFFRDKRRAERVLMDRLFAHPKIDVRWNSEVDSFVGRSDPSKVEGLVLKHRTTGSL